MPKGMSSAQEAFADIEARKNSGGGDSRLWFKLPKPGDTAVVRFLEGGDDVAWCWTHQLPARGKQRYGDDIPCVDQDDSGRRKGAACPGCEASDDRAFNGYINVIWRGAPVFKRDEKGFFEKKDGEMVVVGTADQVAVWNRGSQTFQELAGKEATYKGLMSRDFRITRFGTGFDTKYVIEPVVADDGTSNPTPFTENDKKLMAEKYDFTADTTPGSYEEYKRLRDGGGSNGGVSPESVTESGPFGKPSEDETSAFMKG